MSPWAEVWGILNTNPLFAAFAVIIYLFWEIHFGKLAEWQSTLSALVAVVIALSEEVDGVDENAVRERFNGTDSSYYEKDTRLKDGPN